MKTQKKEPPFRENSLKNKLSELSGLPKDVVMGIPMLTMMGHMELNIENYRGITEYTEQLVRIQTKDGQIKVTGNHLRVEYYTNDEMKVTGYIATIEYVR